ncbi:hypothetical protein EDD18DRAFT_1333502 [Armillaria luteobubalina]|uniref:Uncharacterized protein n=1 Tax=Armillaria luteobubalina TaxID=153913 RepID=A0AA39PZY5_9AGAR|nr:hypothetical protein EDD18DRAFT_1333502 [Armillaria luteobubalina]
MNVTKKICCPLSVNADAGNRTLPVHTEMPAVIPYPGYIELELKHPRRGTLGSEHRGCPVGADRLDARMQYTSAGAGTVARAAPFLERTHSASWITGKLLWFRTRGGRRRMDDPNLLAYVICTSSAMSQVGTPAIVFPVTTNATTRLRQRSYGALFSLLGQISCAIFPNHPAIAHRRTGISEDEAHTPQWKDARRVEIPGTPFKYKKVEIQKPWQG